MKSFYRWYDHVPEPRRFLVAFALAAVGFILLSIPRHPALQVVGLIYLGFILITRILYVKTIWPFKKESP